MRRRRSEVYEAANCLWDVDYRIRCVRSLIPLNPTHHRNFIGKVTLLYVESIGAIITPISSKTEMRDKLMQTPEGISAEIENAVKIGAAPGKYASGLDLLFVLQENGHSNIALSFVNHETKEWVNSLCTAGQRARRQC